MLKVNEYFDGKVKSIALENEEGNATAISNKIHELIDEKGRISVLGYIQRGGNPTRQERILSTRLGAYAVECLVQGKTGVLIGEVGCELKETPFKESYSTKKEIDQELLGLVEYLSI